MPDLGSLLLTIEAWSEFAYLSILVSISVFMELNESDYFNYRNHHKLFPLLLEIWVFLSRQIVKMYEGILKMFFFVLKENNRLKEMKTSRELRRDGVDMAY